MDLILWRHAHAEDADAEGEDLDRVLTGRGEKEAARMGAWLDRRLPEGTKVLCSPARRCEQTVLALGRKYKLSEALAPDGEVDPLLALAQWPDARQHVVLVGHQPTLGRTVAKLLELPGGECPVRKGGLWWLRRRDRDGEPQTVVVAVMTPELA
ncbi:SixA phosphatase family protein [Ramlibacter rhizophilus]|uniref:Histidine phosphatase family protein n=1 Tax=Ramlibacter rhizophilus TaxID=1781167 RepID=A0A4Z0BT81_9BURK|nr:histidine phosphatase family protein [Ramlibacter rhizophilus]TFZ01640.1 histidine phosphatase family protein [Ramlibacter rhizophilus]